ncbi:hypothetical protein [Micromonospora sp. NPDC049645]|uniref:hypothetical protein n=1 Tax=Micromonospora sp. NPDC049645 TaxID=3155508 RepID=UPI00342CD092
MDRRGNAVIRLVTGRLRLELDRDRVREVDDRAHAGLERRCGHHRPQKTEVVRWPLGER